MSVIDIVVPVYRGLQETRRCLDSVLASPVSPSYEVVVIDDATPEPEIACYLDALATNDRVTLLRNETNLGYIGSVNRGMALHPERDVVLLNSDTEVANDWLARLHACVHSDVAIGTATPFSNNATICSYPDFCRNNTELPDGLSVSEVDALFRDVNQGRWIELPTAVGFCMYIRRACLQAVGMFDAGNFGRGYGEENDFSLRAAAAGWKNVLCADVFVFHSGSVSFGAEGELLRQSAGQVLGKMHPEYERAIRRFVSQDPASGLRLSVDLERAVRNRKTSGVLNDVPPSGNNVHPRVRLHISHDLGGGSKKWIDDFCAGDADSVNYVLRPFSRSQSMAEGIALYQPLATSELPLAAWHYSSVIQSIDIHHAELRAILTRLVAEYGVKEILVSSLIGHALDVLDTGLPTTVICHDYFPYCPVICLYFNGVCRSCDAAKLGDCFANNRDLDRFIDLLPAQRLAVRDRYMELLSADNITVVTPSASVSANLLRIDERFRKVFLVSIPHGVRESLNPVVPDRETHPSRRLRILVLGQLSFIKGVNLLSEALDALLEFADVHLVGCQELGELFSHRTGVKVIPGYTLNDLPTIVADIDPDVGLLTSICPESFSYTLGELMMLGIPPVATRVGSFEERIVHGGNGFLFEPQVESMLMILRVLNDNRCLIATVKNNLVGYSARTAAEMVEDYNRVRPRCCRPSTQESMRNVSIPTQTFKAVEALADLQNNLDRRKSFESLSLQLATSRRARDLVENRLVLQREEYAAQSAIAKADIARLQGLVDVKEAAIVSQQSYIGQLESVLREIYSSTAWRLLAPLRMFGRMRRNLGVLKRSLGVVVDQPRSIPRYLRRAREILRFEGIAGLKKAIVRTSLTTRQHDAWDVYREELERNVKPKILAHIAGMNTRPLISIIVPTFNTPEPMLREMLASVVTQLYPNWELCIADDGSNQPHVRRILEEHADADKRIKLAIGTVNKGVSHASNTALRLCTGEFVVLLDHDDILEAHALFRVAQSICEEDPDMLYSDEVLVTEDAGKARQFIHRPAFSPEYLRGHPYIVHMVGFRRSLLLDIGGFDEQLTISQDYDLILRASERSRTIVHIPEILYRWRIHGNSAGHQKMSQVMATSSEILGKHLQRCGEEGSVGEGAGFNLFDIRYPLDPAIRVAIVIPTRNHGDLLRQCIDSIRATVFGIRYDLIVIDHESDDPQTTRYLATLETTASVLRYEGRFNFSAMNNWAVRTLTETHSHILFCNNDIQAITPGWLERMLEVGQRAGNAIVGAKLFYPDRKTIQHAGVCVGAYGRAEHYGKFMRLPENHVEPGYQGALVLNHEVSAVTAACMLVQAGAFEALGGFDESILVGFGDVDLCLRAVDHGYRVIYCAHAELIHHESYTRGICQQDNHPEDTAKFLAKWQYLLAAGDPYYNPGLSLNDTSWQLAQPMPCTYQIRRRIFSRSNESGKQQLSFSAADKT